MLYLVFLSLYLTNYDNDISVNSKEICVTYLSYKAVKLCLLADYLINGIDCILHL